MTGVLLTEKQLSTLWGFARITLRKWRLERKGPPFVKLGTAVRYPAEDAQLWLDGQSVATAANLATSPAAQQAAKLAGTSDARRSRDLANASDARRTREFADAATTKAAGLRG